MIKHKHLIIAVSLALPVCLYVNAGAINKAVDVGLELLKYGFKAFSSKNAFDTDIDNGFIKSKEKWTPGIQELKKQSIETTVNAVNNEVSSEGKEKTKAVLQYFFEKEEANNIASIVADNNIASIVTDNNTTSTVADEKITIPKRKHRLKATFPVTIKANPSSARVRIMNITPVYQDEIELKKGRYDVEVTLRGYRTQRFWVDLDPRFNQLEVNLNKKGSLPCEGVEITNGGSMWQEYGSQIKIVDYFDNVTVAEIYFSQLDILASRNYIEFYHSDISGNFAYFNFIYGFLNKDELYKNKKVKTKSERHNKVNIGIENVPGENRVKMITFQESPQYVAAYSVKEAYCKSLEAL
ncbi:MULTISPECIES: hypothetical protein [unclassified Colwellia]|uniref:hypothetical protein n=1 Tax=unclassified Colwellia TaxID=196834 RepID=UPI0015F7164A|nr:MULTISPECIES: hypothetical protein [unclassified Colwellia]MBA6379700.1 hypothetical protein [Colwellia sp. BRX10-7]MBA6388485.1 hypothetical protein [Colwellia sp. BRX10-2]MBA6403001.1 hypothetical protein [Colwellia sp. BRX10-5]MBA6406318.1 hypothetical protein [Colwellia sp. BRX10-1]